MAKVGPGGHAYYLEVAQGGAGTGVEPPGRWLGTGASALGLRGTVEGVALGRVLAGDHPATGRRLGRAHDRVTVAAFDLSFCAPKSVSLLEALGPEPARPEVRAAHDAAVDAALDYVERRAVAVRRPVGGVALPVAADAVAAAGFVHRTSRALDPHLHSHVVLANLGRGPDGGFTALDGRGLYAHAAAAGALYHAQLRHELTTRLGVGWEPLRNGRADVAGVGPEVRWAFSRRAAAIAEHLVERGVGGGRAAVIAGHATRPERDPTVSADDLRPWWEERARAAGLHPGRLGAVLDRVPRRDGREPPEAPGRSWEVAARLADASPTATRREVVRQWCAALPAGAPAAAVEEAADRMLRSWPATDAHARRAERPGVGERRHVVAGPERVLPDRHVAASLARRGVASRRFERGAGRSVDDDQGLGLG